MRVVSASARHVDECGEVRNAFSTVRGVDTGGNVRNGCQCFSPAARQLLAAR